MLKNGVDVFSGVQTDISAEICADNFAASSFDEARDGVADNRSVEMANMKNFERIGIGKFTNDGLILIDLRNKGGFCRGIFVW